MAENRMNRQPLVGSIQEQTTRALWEVNNVIACVPDELWNRLYCGMPCWKHIYHMLHSLDLWMINPRDKAFAEPPFHEKDMNNLDVVTEKSLTHGQINAYFSEVEKKIGGYLEGLSDDRLLEQPDGCEYTRFTLILAQFRHLHSHMGMIMGFVIEATGLWPRVLGLESPFPDSDFEKYF